MHIQEVIHLLHRLLPMRPNTQGWMDTRGFMFKLKDAHKARYKYSMLGWYTTVTPASGDAQL